MEIKKTVLEILKNLHSKVDFENAGALVDDEILDSFDIATIIADISEEFDIKITANEIVPDNFNSADAMVKMVERLMD